ncbi:MAG: hypothetical protein WCQ99_10305, partial [Pseudomonadota bacterium]
AYAYRGPAPSLDPVSTKAYRFGKIVLEIADLLIEHAWDNVHGGFYTKLTRSFAPREQTKLLSTQIYGLLALNVAYRLTGFRRFREKLAAAVKILEENCFDPENSGAYVSFYRDWTPALREKICGPNLMIIGILSMMAPVVNDLDITRKTLKIWIEPAVMEIALNSSARLTVTLQNQGFDNVRMRVGGMTAPIRWMDPGDIVFDLSPHELKSYTLTITPPKDMPPGVYPFEISAMREGEVGEYVPAVGKIIIR